jgi:Transcriptional regulator, AbiEi antitoxin
VAEGVDKAITKLVRRQHGYVTRGQLLALGLGPYAIRYRIAAERLLPVYPGVYAFGHVPDLSIDRAAGAVLTCGPTAALSHGSASSLWGFSKRWALPFEVTARVDRRRAGIRVHRSTALTGRDVTYHYGIRVTSPARTALDVAPRLNGQRLARFVNDALRSRYLRRGALRELLERLPRHPGTRRLAPFVATPHNPTRSELEDAFLAFAGRFGLPAPEVNTSPVSPEVDALFCLEGLIVELDGFEDHSSRSAFERDRDRDADHLARGLATVRITWERLTGNPEREARRLHAILERRRTSIGKR